jgi:hypothetical protein
MRRLREMARRSLLAKSIAADCADASAFGE